MEGIETIVVDNGSTDGTGEYVRDSHPWARVIRTDRNLGFSGGCNLGAAHSSGKYILFLSDDTVVTPDFLRELVGVMEADPACGIVQSKMLLLENPALVDSVGAYFTKIGILLNPYRGQPDTRPTDSPEEIFAAQGACMMIRAELFNILGGFDEDYYVYFDDTDLCWRGWLAGFRVKVVPRSRIYHRRGATTSTERPGIVVYHTFKNRLCSLLKNLAWRDMATVVPLHLAICLSGTVLFLARLKPRSAVAILGALVWNLANLGKTMRKRNEVSQIAVIPREALFPRLERPMPVSYLVNQALSYAGQW